MAIKRINHLEIEEEADIIKKKNLPRRYGIIFLVLLVLSALLGLTGSGGYFAHKQIRSKDGLFTIKYAAIGRFQVNEELEIILSPQIGAGPKVTISFNAKNLKNFYVKQIMPPPHETMILGDRIIYTFYVSTQPHPLTISFLLEPQVTGFLQAEMNINDLDVIVLNQYVYH